MFLVANIGIIFETTKKKARFLALPFSNSFLIIEESETG
jgi:hypothetical protein